MPTAWNAAGRLQGREDLPLTVETVPDWLVPPELNGFVWLTSPLRRAVGTAHRLGIDAPVIELRLAEMGWGEWEGEILAWLWARLGAEMAMAEAAGLDLRPPGGESPREGAGARDAIARRDRALGPPDRGDHHKGVIRGGVLSLATGWDMRGEAAVSPLVVGGASVPARRRRIAVGHAPQPAAGAGVSRSVLFHVQYLLGIGHLQRLAAHRQRPFAAGDRCDASGGGPPVAELAADSAIRVVQRPPVRARDARFELIDDAGRPLDDGFRARRRADLLAAFDAVRPDAVIIEGFPFARRAFRFELDPLIERLHAAASPPRLICSVRDIVVMRDDPARHRETVERVRREFDAVAGAWGPQADPVRCQLSNGIADRRPAIYTGYVWESPPHPPRRKRDGPLPSPP